MPKNTRDDIDIGESGRGGARAAKERGAGETSGNGAPSERRDHISPNNQSLRRGAYGRRKEGRLGREAGRDKNGRFQ